MSNMQSYEAWEANYSTDNFRRSEPIKAGKQIAPTRGTRRKAPTSVNGIHRRRRRKISW
jgi:hypothetical protein